MASSALVEQVRSLVGPKIDAVESALVEYMDDCPAPLRDAAVNGNGTLARFRRNSAELDLLRARLSELGAMLDTLGFATGGLADMLSDEEVHERLVADGPLDEIGRRLVDDANARGGFDNVTVVLFRVDDDVHQDAPDNSSA